MRIFLSCFQSLTAHSIPAYSFWETYFKKGIAEAGHEWVEGPNIDWAKGCTHLGPRELRAWRDRTWCRTLHRLKRERAIGRNVDLFLSYLYPQQIEVSAIREIQKLGIPCANFFCDNMREFTAVPSEYWCFDVSWVPEFEALEMYLKAGVPVVHAPMPVWIAPEYRVCPTRESIGPTFIGSRDGLREDLLARAICCGANISIRGPGWGTPETARPAPGKKNILYNQLEFIRCKGMRQWLNKTFRRGFPSSQTRVPIESVAAPVWGDDYFRVTRESVLTLGINRVPTFRRSWRNPITYSRLRDIEAPMMGACYLTEWTSGLEYLYDIGTEVEAYHSPEELAAKINQLELDHSRRLQLRRNGQRRALGSHCVGMSLQKLVNNLGLRTR